MEIYFNDILLKDELLEIQLEDPDQLFLSIRQFTNFCKVIRDKKIELRHKTSLNFFASNEIISKFFLLIENKDLENYFREQLLKANVQFWENNRKQNNSYAYYFFDASILPPKSHDINGSTLAEATERRILYPNNPSLALNLPDLVFSKQLSLLIHRHDFDAEILPIFIECADNAELFSEWIEQNLDIEKYHYDINSESPPTDLQTCLRSKVRFEETNYRCQGRKVYREIKEKRLWYVDNNHTGKKALLGKGKKPHLEVFNETGKTHLGEANLEGIIDFNKFDLEKKIEI